MLNRNSRPSDLRNLTYRAESVDISPDPAGLDEASVGSAPGRRRHGRGARGPAAQDIRRLTEEVTESADSPAAKAVAIQAFLRSDEFTYSTNPQAGSGYQALENFLSGDKLGYCEQFAAAMAVMARVAGIPSRVSVGFLPGRRDGDTWRVGIRDMHAWPELYFSGYGWVRFEPTPANVTGAAPNWTVPADESENEPTPSASAQPSTDEATPSAAPSTAPTDDPGAGEDASAFPWGKTLLGHPGRSAGAAHPWPRRPPSAYGVATPGCTIRTPTAPGSSRRGPRSATRWWTMAGPGRRVHRGPSAVRSGNGSTEPDSESMARVATLVERSRYAKTVAKNR